MHQNSKKTIRACLLAVVLAIIFAVVLIRLINLPHTAVYNDETFTILTSQSIIDQGIPTLPSGLFYPYSLFNNYSVALSISIFGDNIIGYKIVSYAFSLLSLLMVYLLGKMFFGRTVGLFSVLLLTISQLETNFALSARMYMQLQFFGLLFIYSFYRGFWEERAIFKILAFIALVCGVYVNITILFLIVPILIFLLIYKKKSFKDKYLLTGLAVVIISVMILLSLPNYLNIPNDWTSGGLIDLFHPSPEYFIEYFFALISEMPWGIVAILSLVLLSINYKNIKRKILYLLLCYFVPLLIIALTAKFFRSRYLLFIFPVYIILSVYGAYQLYNFLILKSHRNKIKIIKVASIMTLLVFSLATGNIYNIGVKSNFRNTGKSFEYIRQHLEPGDIIISESIPLAFYYLNQCDYTVSQFYINGTWYGYTYEKEPRFNAGIVDQLEELQDIFSKNDRIWYAATYYKKNERLLIASQGVNDFLLNNLEPVFVDEQNDSAALLYENENTNN